MYYVEKLKQHHEPTACNRLLHLIYMMNVIYFFSSFCLPFTIRAEHAIILFGGVIQNAKETTKRVHEMKTIALSLAFCLPRFQPVSLSLYTRSTYNHRRRWNFIPSSESTFQSFHTNDSQHSHPCKKWHKQKWENNSAKEREREKNMLLVCVCVVDDDLEMWNFAIETEWMCLCL